MDDQLDALQHFLSSSSTMNPGCDSVHKPPQRHSNIWTCIELDTSAEQYKLLTNCAKLSSSWGLTD